MNRRSIFASIAGGMLVVLALLAISTSAFAQLPGVGGVPSYAPPFDMIGFMQSAGLGAPGSRATFSANNRTQGGWMVINNHPITVPQNTVLQMPATSMTWADLFDPTGPAAVGPAGTVASPYGGDVTAGGTRTGMAMDDPLRMAGTYEVHVQGNIVNGTYIAGLIFIAPQSLNTGNGFVTRIDYNNGDMYVSGGPGGTETKLEINDPLGRFGLAHSPDQRFTIDEDNPTIHAETGYPMCVPRTDPAVKIDSLCPQVNRPANPLGGFTMNFTMPDPHVRTAADPDAYLMAPFEVGDYLTYAGMLVPDASQASGYYISAYNIDANVGIYTAPMSDPVYTVIGEFEQGTGGTANPAFPQETTSRVKVEGMATDSDPRRTALITGRDTDCNGLVSDRSPYWMPALPIDPGPPTGAKRGRVRWRTNGGPFLPPAKEIHVIMNGANTSVPTKNGLFPGQYYAPEFSFIFPENLGVGDPPVSLNLGEFVWLVNGIGPFGTDAGGNPVIIGQLSPFPDMVAPASSGCTFDPIIANAVVTANAGGPYTINLGGTGSGSVALSGASYAGIPAGGTALIRWTILNQQPAGQPQLTLDGGSSSTNLNPVAAISGLTGLTAPITFQLSLVVSNSADPLHPSTASVTTVTVQPPATPPTINAITATPNPAQPGQLVSVSVSASSVNALPLTYTFSNSCIGVGMTQAGPSSSTATFTAPATGPCTVNVTVSDGVNPAVPGSVTVNIQAVVGAPSITSMSATPNPVASNTTVQLKATATDPNNQALTYVWTILKPDGTTYATLTGQQVAFTAPPVTAAQLPYTMTIALKVTNAASVSTTSVAPPAGTAGVNQNVSLSVTAPPADTLTNNGTLYRTSKSRLTVNVISSVVSTSIVLTATLDLTNPATGQKYTGTMQNLGGGAYTLDFIGVGLPNTITVTSTGGGTLTITQAQIAVRQ